MSQENGVGQAIGALTARHHGGLFPVTLVMEH